MDVTVICTDKGVTVREGGPENGPSLGHLAPLSMVSNSFSSPVMRGMRVHGVLVLVATAYTWWGEGGEGVTCQRPGPQAPKVPGAVGWGAVSDLGLHMVSHIVGRAAQRDLPDRPRGIVGQVGRQDTDPQLALGGAGS